MKMELMGCRHCNRVPLICSWHGVNPYLYCQVHTDNRSGIALDYEETVIQWNETQKLLWKEKNDDI